MCLFLHCMKMEILLSPSWKVSQIGGVGSSLARERERGDYGCIIERFIENIPSGSTNRSDLERDSLSREEASSTTLSMGYFHNLLPRCQFT